MAKTSAPQLMLTKRQRTCLRRILNNGGIVSPIRQGSAHSKEKLYYAGSAMLLNTTIHSLIAAGFLVERKQHVVGGLGLTYYAVTENAHWALLRDGALIADGMYRCAYG